MTSPFGGSNRVLTAILISGRGSNMAALLDAARHPEYPAEVGLVLANQPEALGLEVAKRYGVPTAVVDHKTFTDRASFDKALDHALQEARIELIALAGFMRLLTADVTARWSGRMINIHPSLLPAFKGVQVHEQALAAGVRHSGCTVHFVTADMDAGPIIGQARVEVVPGEDPAALAARVLKAEHRLYPAALALVASGRASLENGRTAYTGEAWREVTL